MDKNSYAYLKYIKPFEDQEQKVKRNKVKDWFKSNVFNIVNSIGMIIAILISLIALCKQ